MNELADLFRPFSDSVGGYWSNSNREFDSTNPGILDRVLRTLNPMTGFGSALGSMYDYAGQGDITGMALSTASAMPMFGYARAGGKANAVFDPTTWQMIEKQVPNMQRALLGVGGQLSTNELEDQYKIFKNYP